jgi:hypothetical protein
MRLGAIHAVDGHLHHPLRGLPVLAHSYAAWPAVLHRGTLAHATRHRPTFNAKLAPNVKEP